MFQIGGRKFDLDEIPDVSEMDLDSLQRFKERLVSHENDFDENDFNDDNLDDDNLDDESSLGYEDVSEMGMESIQRFRDRWFDMLVIDPNTAIDELSTKGDTLEEALPQEQKEELKEDIEDNITDIASKKAYEWFFEIKDLKLSQQVEILTAQSGKLSTENPLEGGDPEARNEMYCILYKLFMQETKGNSTKSKQLVEEIKQSYENGEGVNMSTLKRIYKGAVSWKFALIINVVVWALVLIDYHIFPEIDEIIRILSYQLESIKDYSVRLGYDFNVGPSNTTVQWLVEKGLNAANIISDVSIFKPFTLPIKLISKLLMMMPLKIFEVVGFTHHLFQYSKFIIQGLLLPLIVLSAGYAAVVFVSKFFEWVIGALSSDDVCADIDNLPDFLELDEND